MVEKPTDQDQANTGGGSTVTKPTVPCDSCGGERPSGPGRCPHCGDRYVNCDTCGEVRPDSEGACPHCGQLPSKPK